MTMSENSTVESFQDLWEKCPWEFAVNFYALKNVYSLKVTYIYTSLFSVYLISFSWPIFASDDMGPDLKLV